MAEMKKYFFEDLKAKEKEKMITPYVETLDFLVRKMMQQNIAPKEFLALYLLSIPSKNDIKKMAKNRKRKIKK